MNCEEYILSRNDLMKEWIRKHGAADRIQSFAKDGIVCPETWFSSFDEERILFLLKEAYTVETPCIWDECDWICHRKCTEVCDNHGFDCEQCTTPGFTNNALAEWAYGIFQCSNSQTMPSRDPWLGGVHNMREYTCRRDNLLKRTAIVNLKKSNGRNGSSDDDLYYYTSWDRDYLIRQIKMIEPTLIICGGTYKFLRCLFTDLPELKDSNNGYSKYEDVKIIAACHPNKRIRNDEKYRIIIENYSKFKTL